MCDFYYTACVLDCPYDDTIDCPFFDEDVFVPYQYTIWELI